MTLVSTVTVGAGGAAYIGFSSIPQTATDLLITGSARVSTSAIQESLFLYLNSSSAAQYSSRRLVGNGTSAGSGSTSSTNQADIVYGAVGSTATSNTFSNFSIYIPNYTGSTNKSYTMDVVTENNSSESYQQITAGIWANTSAISSFTINSAATLLQNSTFSLYTITKGSGGASVA